MQDNLMYLFAGFFVTWLIMAGYLLSLRRQVENVREEVEALRCEQRESAQMSDATPATADSAQVAVSEETY